MRRKIEEQNLEQTITTKTRTCDRSTRARNGDAARIAKAKKTSDSTKNTKAITKRRMVKTKAVGKKTASAGNNTATDEIIPSVAAVPPAHDLLQEATHELDSTGSREVGCETRAAVLNSTVEEKESGDRKEVEFRADSVETQESTELRRSVILCGLAASWNWMRKHLISRQSRKRLRVCESVSLGEKRFVAVIEVDGAQFLVGGASSSVSTLARLEPAAGFSQMLSRRWAQDPVQA
jgi:flagellar biogenesis protein FliO